MYNIEELEKKWKKYKLRQSIIIIYVPIFLLLISISYFLYNSFVNFTSNSSRVNRNLKFQEINETKLHIQKKENYEQNITAKKESKKEIYIETKRNENSLEKNRFFLKPNLSFLEDNKNSNKEEKNIDNFTLLKNRNDSKVNENILEENSKDNFQIVIKKDKLDIDKLIEKFEKTNDPKIAILISNFFYNEKKYKKSLKWSIIANDLDSGNEESWILFAKAKVKLGKKEDAIKALKYFLSTKNSPLIRKFLDDIVKGEIK